ncbi:MAG: chemotaxis protein CheA [Pseudobdellovibrio sp.]
MELDLELVVSFCDEASDLLNRWEQICLQMKKQVNQDAWQEMFRIAHNIKGGSRAVGLTEFGDFIHKIEDGITLLRDGKVATTEAVVISLLKVHEILVDWITQAKLSPDYKPRTEDCLSHFQDLMSGKIPNQEFASSSQVITEMAKDSQVLVENTTHKTNETISAVNKNKSKSSTKSHISANETIRISAQKLDLLIQTIGELSIHQSIAWHTKNQTSADQLKTFINSLQLGQKITKELYEKALSLRMQPLNSVFQRLERNIIDIAQALQKSVTVVLDGGEVELDKTVIEKIIDPLTHIVRNAVDHGIEMPDARAEKGKSTQGQIVISAHQDAFGVVLTIKDDGKGLIAEKILKKAVEKNLVSSENQMSESDILNLIFLPGFSTAEKITDVSGRGVGMDVVSKALHDLQGTIRIESVPDQGTSFIITLPTSVSIIDGMIVSLAGQNYVIPVGAVEEVINSKRYGADSTGSMISLRDQVVPIYDLGQALKHTKLQDKSERRAMLICRSGKERIAFQVDRVMGQQQIVIRPLNENINGVFGLLGGTILGNGEPGLIIDIPSLTEHYITLTKRKKEAVA